MKRPKVLTKLQETSLLVFYFMFYCSNNSSINTPESSNDFTVVIISFVSSFEMQNIKPFPTLTALFPLILLSNLFIVLEFKLITNPGKLSLAKRIATFPSAFLPKLANQTPRDPPY